MSGLSSRSIYSILVHRNRAGCRLQRGRRVDFDIGVDTKKYGQTPQGDPFRYWSNGMQVVPA